MSGVSWTGLLDLVDKKPQSTLPYRPRDLLLSMWDDRKKDYMGNIDGNLLWSPVPYRDSMFLYRLSESAALRRGGETWGMVPILLTAREDDIQYVPFDILLAMAFSRKNGSSALQEGLHAWDLWTSVLTNFTPLMNERMEKWLSGRGGYPAPFDMKALFSVASKVLGCSAENVFTLRDDLVTRGALFRISPENTIERTFIQNEEDLFGHVASLSLNKVSCSRDLWFETDIDGNISEIKVLGSKHDRAFRRKFFSTSLPWTFRMNEQNLSKLFLDAACPPAAGEPDSPLHPQRAEYFIFMPEDVDMAQPVLPDEMFRLYEYFLDRNMIPVRAQSGFDYLNEPCGKSECMGEAMLRFMAERRDDDSKGKNLWDTTGDAVFLNFFLSGYIHPDMHLSPPKKAPAQSLLRALKKHGKPRMNKAIDMIIKIFSRLETETVLKNGKNKESDRFLLSLPWDENIAARAAFAIGDLSTEFPMVAWEIAVQKYLGKKCGEQNWFLASRSSDTRPEKIPGLDSMFQRVYSGSVTQASKSAEEKNGEMSPSI